MNQVAAVVITFHPDPAFFGRLLSYKDQVDHVFIADNSEPAYEFDALLLNDPKVTLIAGGVNQGIARRLNEVAKMATEAGYKWLLTMDQDSYFEKEHLLCYLEYCNDFAEQKQVAMFGVETAQPPELITNLYASVDRLITSGSLLNLDAFSKVGPFDEKLFIDEVDHEYCYRAICKGFKIIQFTHIFLEHQLGQNKQVNRLKGGVKTASFHSPLRLYYMVRNFLYVRNLYKNTFQGDLKIRGIGLLHRLKNNLLYGPRKLRTLKMIMLAALDFQRGKMGKKL